MSRIGRKPITVPNAVTVTVDDGNIVTVNGPKATLTRQLPRAMRIVQQDSTITVERPSEAKEHKALHGLTRSLLANMVTGVSEGFQKVLEINGVGYRAQLVGRKLQLNLGYSHPVEIEPPAGVSFEVENPTRLAVLGIDKELVGHVAARIRATRKPEPYKGKGVRYAGEVVRRKQGKAGKIGGKK